MNVAILLLNKGRGSGGVAKEHAEFLISQGHAVYFMHPNVGEGVAGANNIDIIMTENNLPVHEYLPSAKDGQKAVSSMNYDEAMAYLPAYENALENIINDVDIVIGHHANLTAIATANICKLHSKPYVLFLHGTGIEPRHHGLYNDKVWAKIEAAVVGANGIIVTTEYVRDFLVRNIIDIPMDMFLIQACGVKMSEFHPDNTDNINEKYNIDTDYVICPGALTESKGPQNIVEASKYYYEHATTIFIGDGDLKEELSEKLGNRGRFLGFVSNEDKAKLINAATLLVAAPEKKEHFGIIYTEAMAGGTPIVAYEGGGVNSIITSETGILTERNPKKIGNEIKSLLLDKEKYSSMKIKSRERAKEYYSTDILGPNLTHWLLNIVY